MKMNWSDKVCNISKYWSYVSWTFFSLLLVVIISLCATPSFATQHWGDCDNPYSSLEGDEDAVGVLDWYEMVWNLYNFMWGVRNSSDQQIYDESNKVAYCTSPTNKYLSPYQLYSFPTWLNGSSGYTMFVDLPKNYDAHFFTRLGFDKDDVCTFYDDETFPPDVYTGWATCEDDLKVPAWDWFSTDVGTNANFAEVLDDGSISGYETIAHVSWSKYGEYIVSCTHDDVPRLADDPSAKVSWNVSVKPSTGRPLTQSDLCHRVAVPLSRSSGCSRCTESIPGTSLSSYNVDHPMEPLSALTQKPPSPIEEIREISCAFPAMVGVRTYLPIYYKDTLGRIWYMELEPFPFKPTVRDSQYRIIPEGYESMYPFTCAWELPDYGVIYRWFKNKILLSTPAAG
jgi:hypothetical protein